MLKRTLYTIFSVIFGFTSTYFLPLFLLVAFNYTKGIQNNEDGILFIPVGFFLIALTLLIDILLARKAFKMNRDDSRKRKWIIAGMIVIVLASVVAAFSAWQSFFECLAHYKGLNLGLQRG